MAHIIVHAHHDSGEHAVYSFTDMQLEHETEPRDRYWGTLTAPRLPGEHTYTIRGANGYAINIGSDAHQAYAGMIAAQADEIAEMRRERDTARRERDDIKRRVLAVLNPHQDEDDDE